MPKWVASLKVWEVGAIMKSPRRRKEVNERARAGRQFWLVSALVGTQVKPRTGAPLTTGYGSLQCFRSRGAAPGWTTCSRRGRGSSGAGARSSSAHWALFSPSSGAAEMDSISWRRGRSGPSSGSASATGHLAPGSFHPCRKKGKKKKKKEWKERELSGCRGEQGQRRKPVWGAQWGRSPQGKDRVWEGRGPVSGRASPR